MQNFEPGVVVASDNINLYLALSKNSVEMGGKVQTWMQVLEWEELPQNRKKCVGIGFSLWTENRI